MTVHAVAQDAGVAALAAMDSEAFADAIRASLGPQAPQAVWEVLTDPLVIGRTKGALGALDRDLLAQLSLANSELDQARARCLEMGEPGRQEYADFRAEQAEWRQRIAGFRRLVLRRMAFVKERSAAIAAAQPRQPPGWGKVARKHNRVALEQLARAVIQHQRAVTSGEGDENDDDTLWAALSSVTAMTAGRGELPLAEWLDYLDELREDNESPAEADL